MGDCGSAEALLNTNRFLLDRQGGAPCVCHGSAIVAPSFVAPDAIVEGSVIGPFASIGRGVTVRDSIVRDSIIESSATIVDSLLEGAIVGRRAEVRGYAGRLNSSAMTR